MAAVTYAVTDFTTGDPIRDETPLTVEAFSDGLGIANGQLQAVLPLSRGVDPDVALAEWRRVVWPYVDGRPMGAYVNTGQQPIDLIDGAPEVTLMLTRCDAVFHHREAWSTLVFSNIPAGGVDQNLIARNFLAYGMGLLPAQVNLGYLGAVEQLPLSARMPWVQLDTSVSDIKRNILDDDAGFPKANTYTIAEIITALSEYEFGFEYRLAYRVDPLTSRPTVRIELSSGRTFGGDPVVGFEYPGGLILGATYGRDATDTENYSRMVGSGDGSTKPMGAVAADSAALNDGWPLLMGSDGSTLSDPAALAAAGRARINRHRGVNEGYRITLKIDALGMYRVGDNVAFRIDHPRFPRGTKEFVARVTEHTVNPKAGTVTIGVQP